MEERLTPRVATALYSLIFEDDFLPSQCWAPTKHQICTIVMKNIVQ